MNPNKQKILGLIAPGLFVVAIRRKVIPKIGTRSYTHCLMGGKGTVWRCWQRLARRGKALGPANVTELVGQRCRSLQSRLMKRWQSPWSSRDVEVGRCD